MKKYYVEEIEMTSVIYKKNEEKTKKWKSKMKPE